MGSKSFGIFGRAHSGSPTDWAPPVACARRRTGRLPWKTPAKLESAWGRLTPA